MLYKGQMYFAKMHFCIAKMHFCTFCFLLCKMHFCYILWTFSFGKIWCWTFSFAKCDAEHFPLENVQHAQCIWWHNMHLLNIFQRKMFSTNKMYASNAFDAKMHLMPKCILMCKNAFDAYILFCVAKMHFCIKCIWCKNAFLQRTTKCYKCIWCQNAFWRTFSKGKCSAYILRSKMFSITFSKGKCSATVCKNAFDAKMHLMRTFCCCVAKMHLMLPLHFVYKMLESGKMHLMQKCIWCVAKMHFAKMHLMQKCILCNAMLHFPLENVQRTFSKGKCSAVQKCIWCQNAFDALPKCILASNAFWQRVHFTK